jgi:hypothetical protein
MTLNLIEYLQHEIVAGKDIETIAEEVEAKAGSDLASLRQQIQELPSEKQRMFIDALHALIERILGKGWLENAEETQFWLNVTSSSFEFWENDDDAIYDSL